LASVYPQSKANFSERAVLARSPLLAQDYAPYDRCCR
jgi:hypothetical protein